MSVPAWLPAATAYNGASYDKSAVNEFERAEKVSTPLAGAHRNRIYYVLVLLELADGRIRARQRRGESARYCTDGHIHARQFCYRSFSRSYRLRDRRVSPPKDMKIAQFQIPPLRIENPPLGAKTRQYRSNAPSGMNRELSGKWVCLDRGLSGQPLLCRDSRGAS